jgi:hypothetical protein
MELWSGRNCELKFGGVGRVGDLWLGKVGMWISKLGMWGELWLGRRVEGWVRWMVGGERFWRIGRVGRMMNIVWMHLVLSRMGIGFNLGNIGGGGG